MKLTTKLILAFLLVSLFSSGVIVASTRVATNREFDKFVNDRYQNELVDELEIYYQENQTWDGIEGTFVPFDRNHSRQSEPQILFFSIADTTGRILVPGNRYAMGEIVSTETLNLGIQIQFENKTVGILLYDTASDRSPMEAEFILRMNNSIFLSGVGTVILALILGTILSRTITRPIRELTAATREMADQKFGHTVPVHSKDEIGDLAKSFNKMSGDLSRSFNLRKQMTADIAHELRTPLSLIIGHAEAVHDGVLPPSAENFEIIREEAERLEQLVNDLRTLSLADAGELSLDFQSVDIHKLLSDIKAHYMITFNQKRISLNFEPATVTLAANLDPIRFSQVLTNILDNALRYTPENGRVDISARQIDDHIEIAIQDSGERESHPKKPRISLTVSTAQTNPAPVTMAVLGWDSPLQSPLLKCTRDASGRKAKEEED